MSFKIPKVSIPSGGAGAAGKTAGAADGAAGSATTAQKVGGALDKAASAIGMGTSAVKFGDKISGETAGKTPANDPVNDPAACAGGKGSASSSSTAGTSATPANFRIGTVVNKTPEAQTQGDTQSTSADSQMSQMMQLMSDMMKLFQQMMKMTANSQVGQTDDASSQSDSSDISTPDTSTQIPATTGSTGGTGATGDAGAADGAGATGQAAQPETDAHGFYTPDQITTEKDNMQVPTEDNLKNGRPEGDNRSADEIINDNPALKNLGNQKDIKQDELKKRFGDWTADNPDPKSRADAAFRMSKVLNFIDNIPQKDGTTREGNGDITGITSSGDARHGTEAGILKDVAEQGLGKLKNEDGNYALTEGDGHTKPNGTNYDNFQWGMKKIGEVLSKIPLMSSLFAPIFKGMGEGDGLKGVLTGGLKGFGETIVTRLKMAAGFLTGGPAGLARAVAKQAVEDTISIATKEAMNHNKSQTA